MERTILHCDMNNFFASVELLEHPELAELPVAVCGNPKNRHGIILAKNMHAKRMGVKTAETLWQAKRKCPDLVTLPPHMHKYKEHSKLINEIYSRYTDMVEPFSIDESWLDVTGSLKLFGTGPEIAEQIHNTVREELSLTLSIGVSFNKIFAKMGSEYKKPDATTVITRENYKDILWPMDVGEMFFVGNASAQTLRKYGINTIGDLAASDKNHLTNILGKMGSTLWEYANGLDDAPVLKSCEREKIKSVGNGVTFKRNLKTEDDIRVAVVGLSDKVAYRLRKYEMKACGVKIDIKDPEFHSISRQKLMERPTNLSLEISKAAMSIIKESWNPKKEIRLLTVTAISLCDEDVNEQLNFFTSEDSGAKRTEDMEKAVDEIRKKYGTQAISFGRLINNDIGISLDYHEDD